MVSRCNRVSPDPEATRRYRGTGIADPENGAAHCATDLATLARFRDPGNTPAGPEDRSPNHSNGVPDAETESAAVVRRPAARWHDIAL